MSPGAVNVRTATSYAWVKTRYSDTVTTSPRDTEVAVAFNDDNNRFIILCKAAMEALGGRGGIAPTHSRPRN
jgi:hypothetical protein